MANKFVVVFLVCIVVFATSVNISEATLEELFKACFHDCIEECKSLGRGNTFCEMKCDTDCMAKEAAARLNP